MHFKLTFFFFSYHCGKKISIWCIGKTDEKYLIEGIDKYIQRLTHYTKIEYEVFKDVKSGQTSEETLKREAEMILAKLKSDDLLVLMDERGDMYMLVVVNTVSFLVHLYSWGYMAEDPHKARFFSYLSFFTFSMLALVTANDFLQLFFGWEGVGVASYLLIGFWYQKRTANDAAIKAFVTNRVGDFASPLASWPRSSATARSSSTPFSRRPPPIRA